MTEPLVFLNGQDLPASQAALPLTDLGFVHGATVTEMIRTFQHQPFMLQEHLARLYRSLELVGITLPLTAVELADQAQRIVAHNAALVPADQDLGIVIFATPGQNPTYLGAAALRDRRPTVCIHTFPLPYELWRDKYTLGQRLVIPEVRQIPQACVPPGVKHRSRMHWFLADQQARQVDPLAAALVLNLQGEVTETSSGNVFVVAQGTLRTPPLGDILGGISRDFVLQLAQELEMPVEVAPLSPEHVFAADEVWTSSTPTCLLPVVSVNQQAIGSGEPGPRYQRMLAAWSNRVGVDIAGQMQVGGDGDRR